MHVGNSTENILQVMELILLESYFRFGVEGGAVVDRKSDAKINEK
jgi:hypothetical protein